MKDIAIYGAGGLGREVACLIKRINEIAPIWNLIGFFDDGRAKGEILSYGPILGGIEEVNSWPTALDIVIAIGSPQIIKSLTENINNPNIKFPNIIAPDTIFLDKDSCDMGYGNIICTGCCLSCDTTLGNFNQLNGYITVGHDTKIGNYNSFMAGVRISGEVSIGDCNFWGFNSGIVQQKSVGNNVTVGAGAILIRKPKDGNTYIGVPASIVKY